MPQIDPLTGLDPARFDRPDILKKLASASRRLAELKGVVAAMPNEGIFRMRPVLSLPRKSRATERL